jgi:ABC-type spermidine/putrescine transport system permease subunit II
MNRKLPVWFRIVATIAIVWNALGIFAFVTDVTLSDAALAAMPEAQRDLYVQTPVWVTAAYAVAVFAGLAGSIALALRKSLATTAFGVSLAALIVQMGYQFAIAKAAAVLGTTSLIMPAVITAIAVALLWFSMHANRLGWLS